MVRLCMWQFLVVDIALVCVVVVWVGWLLFGLGGVALFAWVFCFRVVASLFALLLIVLFIYYLMLYVL